MAVTRIGSSTDFTMRLVLRKAGLQPDKDVAFVQLGDLASLAAALGTKAIAAAAFGALSAHRSGCFTQVSPQLGYGATIPEGV